MRIMQYALPLYCSCRIVIGSIWSYRVIRAVRIIGTRERAFETFRINIPSTHDSSAIFNHATRGISGVYIRTLWGTGAVAVYYNTYISVFPVNFLMGRIPIRYLLSLLL